MPILVKEIEKYSLFNSSRRFKRSSIDSVYAMQEDETDREKLLYTLRDESEKLGKIPGKEEFKYIEELPSMERYNKEFGSVKEAARVAGLVPDFGKNIYSGKEVLKIFSPDQEKVKETGFYKVSGKFEDFYKELDKPNLKDAPRSSDWRSLYGEWLNSNLSIDEVSSLYSVSSSRLNKKLKDHVKSDKGIDSFNVSIKSLERAYPQINVQEILEKPELEEKEIFTLLEKQGKELASRIESPTKGG
ncbi:MAG: hypothetical protein MUP58_02225 [Candidatus Nanohaloarchaeota archaeon QJJ-9]|nr:hypothetical protein [Candidatus Nanohaloarchaeota archaeon QJJ-9]